MTNKFCKQARRAGVSMLALLIGGMPLAAKSVKDLWLDMPEGQVGYLDRAKCLDLLDYWEKGVGAEVKNALEGNTRIDTLTDNYLSVKLSEASQLQMKRLPVPDADSLLCVVRTYWGPKPESVVTIYNQAWELKSRLEFDEIAFLQRPDTMSLARFEELSQLLQPCMVCASLAVETDELTLCADAPNMVLEEESSLKAVLLKRKLKWDGVTFK